VPVSVHRSSVCSGAALREQTEQTRQSTRRTEGEALAGSDRVYRGTLLPATTGECTIVSDSNAPQQAYAQLGRSIVPVFRVSAAPFGDLASELCGQSPARSPSGPLLLDSGTALESQGASRSSRNPDGRCFRIFRGPNPVPHRCKSGEVCAVLCFFPRSWLVKAEANSWSSGPGSGRVPPLPPKPEEERPQSRSQSVAFVWLKPGQSLLPAAASRLRGQGLTTCDRPPLRWGHIRVLRAPALRPGPRSPVTPCAGGPFVMLPAPVVLSYLPLA
jgi:hypothetical protein